MKNHIIVGATAVALSTGSAFAGGTSATEIEPNDSLLTAQSLGPFSGAIAILGALDALHPNGDVDFFSFSVGANTLITASVFDFTPALPDDHDSVLALMDSTGTILAFNDDSMGLLSSLSFIVSSAGTYTIALSGFPDNDFNGGHSEVFTYKLVLNALAIPAPGAAALLPAFAVLAARRRRA